MTDLLADLAWRDLRWLWLALAPWALWLVRAVRTRERAGDYAARHLLPWAQAPHQGAALARYLWRHVGLALAWLLFAIALAGPRLPQAVDDVSAERYTEVLVVMDLSRSMTAGDVAPGRLERARLELHDFVRRARRLRIGLVVYAARPHLLVPPTADKRLLGFYIEQLRYGLLPTEGSALADALAFAGESFGPARAARAILLVSDGDTGDDDARLDQRVNALHEQGIRLFALGVGTESGSTLLTHDGRWLVHNGEQVVSRLHRERLQRLTRLGDGHYAPVDDADGEWRVLYERGIGRLPLQDIDTAAGAGTQVAWRQLHAWALFPAMVLWLAVYIRPRRVVHRVNLVTVLFVALLAFAPAGEVAAAEPDARPAWEAYTRGDYEAALQAYTRVPGYAGRMGEGVTAYRLGRYGLAKQQFVRAVLAADDDKARADALFNLANTHYRAVDYAEAAALYRDVLRYRPGDVAAQRNLGYALALQSQQQRELAAGKGGSGRGPRAARLPPGTDVASGSMGLDDTMEAVPLPAPGGAPLSPADAARERIARARPAARTVDESDDPSWTYDIGAPEGVALKANSIRVDESILWQRIIEQEENFPGLVETPYELPGVQPW